MSNWHEDFLALSWNDFRAQAFALCQKIAESDKELDLIVAIARGGLTLSQLISDALQIPIATFTAKSYRDLKQQSLPQITHGLGATLEGKKVLLVDDVSDTGKTFVKGVEYLIEISAEKENISTASLHYKPQSVYKPDFFILETSKWIVYPYEVKETIIVLTPKWRADGETEEEIKKRFLYFNFPKEQIESFFKM